MIALKVVTPKGKYMTCNVKSIHVKSVEGEMTILPNHVPIFASLVPCKMVLENEKGVKEDYAVSGGFIKFDHNEASLLTDAIEGKEDIDLARAQAALERAKRRLAKKDSKTNYQRAELALYKAINRINVRS